MNTKQFGVWIKVLVVTAVVMCAAVLAATHVRAAANGLKYPYEITVRPVENGYVVRLLNTSYGTDVPSPVVSTEVVALDSAQVTAVVKAWMDAIKAYP